MGAIPASATKGVNMPAKSKAQQKILFAKKPEIAEEFAVKGKKYKALPEHVKKKKKDKKK